MSGIFGFFFLLCASCFLRQSSGLSFVLYVLLELGLVKLILPLSEYYICQLLAFGLPRTEYHLNKLFYQSGASFFLPTAFSTHQAPLLIFLTYTALVLVFSLSCIASLFRQ